MRTSRGAKQFCPGPKINRQRLDLGALICSNHVCRDKDRARKNSIWHAYSRAHVQELTCHDGKLFTHGDLLPSESRRCSARLSMSQQDGSYCLHPLTRRHKYLYPHNWHLDTRRGTASSADPKSASSCMPGPLPTSRLGQNQVLNTVVVSLSVHVHVISSIHTSAALPCARTLDGRYSKPRSIESLTSDYGLFATHLSDSQTTLRLFPTTEALRYQNPGLRYRNPDLTTRSNRKWCPSRYALHPFIDLNAHPTNTTRTRGS
jgi:hypothetical protein